MSAKKDLLKNNYEKLKMTFKPVILRIYKPEERDYFNKLINTNKVSFIHDKIFDQLKELIKCQNPSLKISENEYQKLIDQHINEGDIYEYGVWVYYPWNQRLVHLLDNDEFIEVRTNRNQYKITKQERNLLSKKKIGIIGLSVGQSIALTLAMERSCGELRLADFDTLELSNLNRIRTGVFNLGESKVVIAAREIAEIDPYLNVSCFFEGLTEDNLNDFFLKNGKLDLLVDECDGLDMKIISRYKARDLKIPVIMDTSDRGMLDVERFDLEPNRSLLHGTTSNINPKNIKELSNEDKIPVILQMLGAENISLRGKVSMVEVQQTINTWPQLASSVTLGGAVATDVCRRILLDQFKSSGRYYIDLEELIADKDTKNDNEKQYGTNPFKPLKKEEMLLLANKYSVIEKNEILLDKTFIKNIIESALAAPSTGNDQPWKWLYKKGLLYLFHDEYRSYSFGDYQKQASYISFGATFENLYISALKNGFETVYDFMPVKNEEKLVAVISFKKSTGKREDNLILPLNKAILNRHTNRNPSGRKDISLDLLYQLSNVTKTIKNAQIKFFTAEDDLKLLAKIIGACDRIRLLNPEGHQDFVNREMRWTSEEAEMSKDGIDIKTLGLNNSQMAALSMIKDARVIQTISKFDGGKALDLLAMKTVGSASALCLITMPKHSLQNFFEGGRAMERFWLAATNLNLAIHPLISPLYLFSRILYGNGEGLDKKSINELRLLRKEFVSLTKVDNNAEIFLSKISFAEEPLLKAHRLPLDEVFFNS